LTKLRRFFKYALFTVQCGTFPVQHSHFSTFILGFYYSRDLLGFYLGRVAKG
jgi:hypothetical protein